jgi:pilus assembly protein CpaE
MSTALTVVLVHRDDAERAALRAAFDAMPGVAVAGERPDLRAGLALAHQSRPGILVLELAHPVDETLGAAAHYRLEHPDCAIFVVTDIFDPDTLLRAMRAGASEVLRRPLDRAALTQAVERVAALSARRSGAASGRDVITVFSSKGGSGISSLATNLAVCLHQACRREVVLADFDDQSGDAAFMLGLNPQRSMSDVLLAPRIDSAGLHAALIRHDSGLQVLSQPEQLDRDGATPEQSGTIVELLSSMFETVVIDAPHTLDDRTVEIFDRSSTLLLVTEPSIPSVRAARRSLEILHKLNFLAVPDRVRLVVNRRGDASAITVAQLEETLGLPVFGTVANDYAAVSRAINLGRPLCLDPGDSRAAKDILSIARRLVPGQEAAEAPVESPARRPLLRLFGKG